MNKNFHCCATCEHFRAEKLEDGMRYYCARLGFDTKTTYQFNCWRPKDHIRKLMEQDQSNK
ncbi:hypothetical protein [Texcoconibacillus texcoconensis]|uniref:Uncharacterized protein n=1 Tax=Texcoconibacillus texcoconensis TaxID=1095777 RepID=A0A840QMN8_9BACI|nr:hypothetical protein [Texcoconibacillus texcoconensis]MBB5172639.1 hypothetical protein [Texcoconibacillus texcoconensis]